MTVPCAAGNRGVSAMAEGPGMGAAAPTAAPAAPHIPENSLLARLDMQPRVRDFLARAVASGRVGHAYLFLGAPGSGKHDAAWALAQALLCGSVAPVAEGPAAAEEPPVPGEVSAPSGPTGTAAQAPALTRPCGACDDCVRVARHSHPDVHLYQPESATGYLISQTRELLSDVALAPIRARSKVYIIDRAEQMRANTANALLKTLEEPPAGVTFILLGTSASQILPTIVSRCQCVPFRMVSPDEAAASIAQATGADVARCRVALSVAGSPARAVEFLESEGRQGVRQAMLRALGSLPKADEADVLSLVSNDLGDALGAVCVTNPFGGSRKKADEQEAIDKTEAGRQINEGADFLSRAAIRQLEDRAKREVTARNRSAIMEAIAAARSLLRDVLMRVEGVPGDPVNADAEEIIERLASRATVSSAAAAIDAVSRAEARVTRNVTPQLAVEVMLLDIRKALICP